MGEASQTPLKHHLINGAVSLGSALRVFQEQRHEFTDQEIKQIIIKHFDEAIEHLENFENHPDASLVRVLYPDVDDGGLIPAKQILTKLISELKLHRKWYIKEENDESVNYTNQDVIDFLQFFYFEKFLLFQARSSMILALQEEFHGQEGAFEAELLQRGLGGGVKSRKRKTKSHRKKMKKLGKRRKPKTHRKKKKSRKTKRRIKM